MIPPFKRFFILWDLKKFINEKVERDNKRPFFYTFLKKEMV